MTSACDIRVRGVVQGVGFRPFVFRLAQANTLAGWVLNDEEGVEIHLEGAEPALDEFVRSLMVERPPAATNHAIDIHAARAGRVQRIHDPRQPPEGTPQRPNLARPAGVRCVPRRAIRPREPALSISLHQLHQLRPALFRDVEPALRPR